MDQPQPVTAREAARVLLAADTTLYRDPDEHERYVVGGVTDSLTIPEGMRQHPAALAMVAAYLTDRPVDAETVGSWTFAGAIHFDHGTTHADRLDAARVAAERGELAYFDTEAGYALYDVAA